VPAGCQASAKLQLSGDTAAAFRYWALHVRESRGLPLSATRRLGVALLALVGISGLSASVAADPASPTGAVHGFYARLGLGVGYGAVQSQINVPSNDWGVEYHGVGWVFDGVAGATIDDWLALGGGLFATGIPALAAEADPGRVTLSEDEWRQDRLALATLGPVVDVFLDSRGAPYVGALAGVGGIGLDDKDGGWSLGWSIGAHGGYDVWVSEAWTLGVSLRYLYTRSTRELLALPGTTQPGRVETTAQDSASTLGLSFNVAYR